MRCAPYAMRSYLAYVLFRPHGFAKAAAKQPTGLFLPPSSLRDATSPESEEAMGAAQLYEASAKIQHSHSRNKNDKKQKKSVDKVSSLSYTNQVASRERRRETKKFENKRKKLLTNRVLRDILNKLSERAANMLKKF